MKDRPVAKNDPRSTPGAREGERDLNRDPLSGTPGAHPVGTGVGALAGGAAAGAAIGTVAGPIGTVVGAAVGAVAGGLAGKGIAEQINPTAEDAYWQDSYASRPYVAVGSTYDDYGPAYRFGVDSYGMYGGGRSFDEVEPDLGNRWSDARGSSGLGWDDARNATRDSWQRLSDRLERPTPGDKDRDGL